MAFFLCITFQHQKRTPPPVLPEIPLLTFALLARGKGINQVHIYSFHLELSAVEHQTEHSLWHRR